MFGEFVVCAQKNVSPAPPLARQLFRPAPTPCGLPSQVSKGMFHLSLSRFFICLGNFAGRGALATEADQFLPTIEGEPPSGREKSSGIIESERAALKRPLPERGSARRSRFTAARHSVPAQDGGGAAAARSAGVIEAAAAGGSRAAPAGRRGERSGTVLAREEEEEGEEGGFALPPALPPSGEEGRLSCASWEAFCLVPQRPKYRKFNGWVFFPPSAVNLLR